MTRLAAFAASLCFVFVAATMAQGPLDPKPTGPAIEEVYLARDNGTGKAGEQAEEFRTTDVPIYCVVLLDNTAKVTVKMNFVAVKVTGVKPETKVVSASYTTSESQNRVNFTGSPDGSWVPGRYRVDLFLNAKPAKSVEFSILGDTTNVAAASFVRPAAPPRAKPPATKRQRPH